MPFPAQPSEKIIYLDGINPANNNNATFNSGWIDMRKFQEALFILQLGAVDIAINAKLQEAKDSGGTGAQDISGKAMTALTGTDDNKQVLFNLKAEECSLNAGYGFARIQVTVGAGTTN